MSNTFNIILIVIHNLLIWGLNNININNLIDYLTNIGHYLHNGSIALDYKFSKTLKNIMKKKSIFRINLVHIKHNYDIMIIIFKLKRALI